MKILNLFFIGMILYLCYKIFTMNEQFQTTQSIELDLSGKNLIFGRNLGINMNENKLEELNKLDIDIDLSKNNLLIDNKYENKVSIKKELCIGNFCINKDKLKLIAGKIDAPQFYKTDDNGNTDKPVYYNNDCNITNKTNKYCNIESVKDLPNKICFNYETTNPSDTSATTQNKLCIGPAEFDILKGKRGIKLKNVKSNSNIDETSVDDIDKSTIMYHKELEKTYTYNKYLMPYYADFRETGMDIESTKDQLLFKNNHQCTNTATLYTENPDFDPRKYPYYKDAKSELNCENVDCNDPFQSRLCLHTCAEHIIERENEKENSNDRLFNIEISSPTTQITDENTIEPPAPKIINKDGWIVDEGWERSCVVDNEQNKDKKLYCMKYKSKPIESDIDSDIKTGKSKKDRGRQGRRKYNCNSRPNWEMVRDKSLLEESKNKIKNSTTNIKYMFPEALMYGIDTIKDWFDDGDDRYAKWNSDPKDPDYKALEENITKYRADLNLHPLSTTYGAPDGILRKDGMCCNYQYGKRTRGFCWTKSCRDRDIYKYGGNKNRVNSCIADYNIVRNLQNEFDVENNHGWYKLPESDAFPIDPNYKGYYIDKNNNNSKYIINDNAVAKGAKFLGNVDNHRVSHDGVCGESNKDVPNMHYFCNGPNSNNPLYNKVCNPITNQHSKIQQCMNEKRNVDMIDILTSEPTTSIALTEEEQQIYNADLETCILQNSGESLIDVNSQKNLVNQQTNDIIDSRYKELNELDELNYFIQPSKDNSGNMIKSNTYFHVHKHKHI